MDLYTDGGVLECNPSSKGGSWCWIAVEDDKEIARGYGLITPADLDLPWVSCNVTELLAATEALESIPEGELMTGKLYLDSGCTQHRLRSGCTAFKGIPDDLRPAAVYQAHRLKPETQLLGGHPTKKDLIAGRRKKDGMLVSKWNVACDDQCQELSRMFLTLLDVKTADQWEAWKQTVNRPEEWWVGVESETKNGVAVFGIENTSHPSMLFGNSGVHCEQGDVKTDVFLDRPVWLWHETDNNKAMQAWNKRNKWEPYKEMA